MGVTKPTKKSVNWRQQNPRTLLNKMIGVMILREIGAKNILKLEDKVLVEQIIFYDDDNNPFINWEEVMFKLTQLQVSRIIAQFSPASMYDETLDKGMDGNNKRKYNDLMYVGPLEEPSTLESETMKAIKGEK